MKTKEHVIYALIDPSYYTVRYVGLSNDCEIRLRQHLSCKQINKAKIAWLKGLKDNCRVVIMEILDKAVDVDDAKVKEAFWIDYYCRQNAPLTNIIHPKPTIPHISMFYPGLLEFDVPAKRGDWFLQRLHESINNDKVVINGAELFAEIEQVTIYVDTWEEGDWMDMAIKFGRRALIDRFISCYRYRVYGNSWAVFGDEMSLNRRLQASSTETFKPWIKLMHEEMESDFTNDLASNVADADEAWPD